MNQPFAVAIEGDITRVVFTQKPTLESTVAALQAVAALDAPTDRLWEFRAGLDLSGPFLQQISEHSRRILPMAARVAFVAPDELSFGLSRAYSVYREQPDSDFRVFHDEGEALAWLRAGRGGDRSP